MVWCCMSGRENAELAKRWFASANHDRRIIRTILSEQLWAGICFHAQQCAEKSIKGLLTTLDIPFQKTHSIKELVYLLEKNLPESLRSTLPLSEMQRAAKLDRHYLPSRYPDAQFGSLTVEDLYDEEDAADSINKAEFLYQKSLEIASGVLGRPAYLNESGALHLDQLIAKVQRLEQRIASRESSVTDSAASSIPDEPHASHDCDQPPPPRRGPR